MSTESMAMVGTEEFEKALAACIICEEEKIEVEEEERDLLEEFRKDML